MSHRFSESSSDTCCEAKGESVALSRRDLEDSGSELFVSDPAHPRFSEFPGETELLRQSCCSVLQWLPDRGEFQMRGHWNARSLEEWLLQVHSEDRERAEKFLNRIRQTGQKADPIRLRLPSSGGGNPIACLALSRDPNRREPVLHGFLAPLPIDVTREEDWIRGLSTSNHQPDPAYLRPLRDALRASALGIVSCEAATSPRFMAVSFENREHVEELAPHRCSFSSLIRNDIRFDDPALRKGAVSSGDSPFASLYIQTLPVTNDSTLAVVACFDSGQVPSERELAFASALLFEKGKRIQEARMRQQLEEMMRQSERLISVGRLTAGVAHDFNNLLTVIQGHTSFLQGIADDQDDEASLDSIRLIQKATTQAVCLAEQLLHFGKDHATRFEKVDLNDIVSGFVQLIRRMVEETIDISLDLEEEGRIVSVDQGMIGQILMNLVINARDALNGKGKISISTAFHRDLPGTTRQPRNGWVVLSVEDNGPGIPGEHLEKVFTPFFSTKGRNKGTGLGLANVKALVERQEGWLDVTSQPGTGTRFDIGFPLVANQPEEGKKKVNVSSPGRSASRHFLNDEKSISGSQVLLVEDESSVRMLVKKLLEMHGCTVIEATSGKQALDLWPEVCDEISVVVSDIVMPEGVSGWDLAKALHEKAPDVGILLTSGYNERPEDHGLGDDPRVAFLQKPYEAKKLKSNIFDLLHDTAS